jgi:hypothetical protein
MAETKADTKEVEEPQELPEEETPGVHDVKAVVHDEPESSYSPSTTNYPAVPEQIPTQVEQQVSIAPTVWGVAYEAPVLVEDAPSEPELPETLQAGAHEDSEEAPKEEAPKTAAKKENSKS